MYCCFIISGAVDLLAWAYNTSLPQGTDQLFLALAFLGESLLFGLHEKHEPLDKIVHAVLFYSNLSTAACVLLEVAYPRSLMPACGRVASTYLQATWFYAAARIMFEQRPAWDRSADDIAPVVMIPTLFTAHIVCIVLGMAVVFVFMRFLYGRK